MLGQKQLKPAGHWRSRPGAGGNEQVTSQHTRHMTRSSRIQFLSSGRRSDQHLDTHIVSVLKQPPYLLPNQSMLYSRVLVRLLYTCVTLSNPYNSIIYPNIFAPVHLCATRAIIVCDVEFVSVACRLFVYLHCEQRKDCSPIPSMCPHSLSITLILQ